MWFLLALLVASTAALPPPDSDASGRECYERDVDYPDNNLNDGSKELKRTALECQELCYSNDACVAFTWITDSIPEGSFFSGRERECWIKHTKSTKKPDWPTEYLVSGPKHCGIGLDSSPTVLQYILEVLSSLRDKQDVPEDFDIDKDGTISEMEVDIKIRGYMKEIFQKMDQNADNILTEDEFRNMRIDFEGVDRIMSIALDFNPLKELIGLLDANKNGYFDEDDFVHGLRGRECYEMDVDYPDNNLNDGSKELKRTALECQELCYSNDACIAFTWISDYIPEGAFFSGRERECWIKHTKSNKKPAWPTEYLVSGPKHCGVGLGYNPVSTILLKTFGPYIFIADTNLDKKVTMDEFKTKVRALVSVLVPLLDQTDDGFLSVQDCTSLNLRTSALTSILMELFEVLAKQSGHGGSIDILNNPLTKLIARWFAVNPDTFLDKNSDGVVNLKDFYQFFDENRPGQAVRLIGIVERNLDANQDGKIEYNELLNFVRVIRENMDNAFDPDGDISLKDVYSLAMDVGFSCLQVEEVRTFVERWAHFVETGVDKLLAYFFTQFDLDGNGEILLEEFYNIHVPCEVEGLPMYGDYGGYEDYDGDQGAPPNHEDSKGRVSDGRSEKPKRHHCYDLEFIFFPYPFPTLPSFGTMFEGRRPMGQGRYGSRSGPSLVEKHLEKLANSACMIMQPQA